MSGAAPPSASGAAGAVTLFISDLHLDGERPDITAQFLEFLDREARQAQALYILGDLFEAWIGDDDPDPDKRRVIAALRALTQGGVRVYFIHGNRDFLIGQRFSAETGVRASAKPANRPAGAPQTRRTARYSRATEATPSRACGTSMLQELKPKIRPGKAMIHSETGGLSTVM